MPKKHTKETKDKIRKSLLGKIFSKERKRNISIGQLGKKLTEEHKRKIGLGNRGKTLSIETKQKIALKLMGNKNSLGFGKEKHSQWIENPTNYQTIHYRIRLLYGDADRCENKFCSGKCKDFEWANKDHKYSLKREDWKRLCVICHHNYDGRRRDKYGKFLASN